MVIIMPKYLPLLTIILSIMISLLALLFNIPFLFFVVFLPPIVVSFGIQRRRCPYCGSQMKGRICPRCGFVIEEDSLDDSLF